MNQPTSASTSRTLRSRRLPGHLTSHVTEYFQELPSRLYIGDPNSQWPLNQHATMSRHWIALRLPCEEIIETESTFGWRRWTTEAARALLGSLSFSPFVRLLVPLWPWRSVCSVKYQYCSNVYGYRILWGSLLYQVQFHCGNHCMVTCHTLHSANIRSCIRINSLIGSIMRFAYCNALYF